MRCIGRRREEQLCHDAGISPTRMFAELSRLPQARRERLLRTLRNAEEIAAKREDACSSGANVGDHPASG